MVMVLPPAGHAARLGTDPQTEPPRRGFGGNKGARSTTALVFLLFVCPQGAGVRWGSGEWGGTGRPTGNLGAGGAGRVLGALGCVTGGTGGHCKGHWGALGGTAGGTGGHWEALGCVVGELGSTGVQWGTGVHCRGELGALGLAGEH